MDQNNPTSPAQLLNSLIVSQQLPSSTRKLDPSLLFGSSAAEAPAPSAPSASSLLMSGASSFLNSDLGHRIESTLPSQQMAGLMFSGAGATPPPAPRRAPYSGMAGMGSPMTTSSVSLPTVLPALASLGGRIAAELEASPQKLLTLNPSRRDAIAQYLDRLAGIAPSTTPQQDPLRRWITNPRTPAQNFALKTYFEEVAWLTLAQALVLKAWSDRGLRPWSEADVGKLNWVLSSALKPHVPLDRDGWQITSRNLYSWYTAEAVLQQEIWRSMEAWRISDEGPELLVALLRHPRQSDSDAREHKGYDSRFFKAIWEQLRIFGFTGENAQLGAARKPCAFTPTLRSGAIVRSAPVSFQWIGFEANPFQIMVAELVQLWWGPSAPPIWSNGSGLEAHTRDQLSLSLGSPKPTILNRIAEMEACDLSFVLEERCVRPAQRTAEAAALRQQLEQLPYFKKIRNSSTSLGTLQACVAATKLRPGGQLWWSREEPLRSSDGTEALGFLLDRGRLVCEWDFSAVEHSLPASSPLFPKYLYLFVREPDFQKRLEHRPIRVTVQGQIRSHIELPLFLSEVLQSPTREGARASRAHWQIHAHLSPTSQKDWAERWPDPTAHETLEALEGLRQTSVPLASLSTIRPTPTPATPGPGAPATRTAGWTISDRLKGLWLQLDPAQGGRLTARPLPRPGSEAVGSGFLVLVSDETWIAPLCRYFESERVRQWVDHHAERRGEKAVLTEQLVKFLPIPNRLMATLGAGPLNQARMLSSEWENLLAGMGRGLGAAHLRERLSSLPYDEAGSQIRTEAFVRATRLLEQLLDAHQTIFAMVGNEGRIRWRDLLNILPKSECIPATLHPEIQLKGQLPPHLPIGRFDRVKVPSAGVLMSTEAGMSLHLGCEDSRMLEIILEQLEGLKHPTWNELSQFLRAPRRLDVAVAAAEDVLRVHAVETARQAELLKLIAICAEF